MADIQIKFIKTLSFAFSTAAYALAYLALATAKNTFSDIEINNTSIFLFIIIVGLCFKFFFDLKDNQAISPIQHSKNIFFILKNEILLVKKDLSQIRMRKALAAFFTMGIIIISILLTQVDFNVNRTTHIAQSMMYGYLLGVLILVFLGKIKDNKIIKTGYCISVLVPRSLFYIFKFTENQISLIKVCYFFHALGNAFLSPAFLSILALRKNILMSEVGLMV